METGVRTLKAATWRTGRNALDFHPQKISYAPGAWRTHHVTNIIFQLFSTLRSYISIDDQRKIHRVCGIVLLFQRTSQGLPRYSVVVCSFFFNFKGHRTHSTSSCFNVD